MSQVFDLWLGSLFLPGNKTSCDHLLHLDQQGHKDMRECLMEFGRCQITACTLGIELLTSCIAAGSRHMFRFRLGSLPPIPAGMLGNTSLYITCIVGAANHTFLGLLAKIKCSICSLEFDNSNGGHCPPCYLTYFSGGLPNSDACIAGLAAWPWHCTTAMAEHPHY